MLKAIYANMQAPITNEELNMVKDVHVRKILANLSSVIAEKDQQIIELRNEITDLKSRVAEQERYTSKDCLIIENLPWNRQSGPLVKQVCEFFRAYLSFNIQPDAFKACHPLSQWRDDKKPPPVIVKFIYFEDKNEIYARKSWLATKLNRINGLPILMKERLPKHDKAIRDHANEAGLITTSTNCRIKVFVKDQNGYMRSVPVLSHKAVDDIKERAVKKEQRKVSTVKPTQSSNVGRNLFNLGRTPSLRNHINGSRVPEQRSMQKRNLNSPEDDPSLSMVHKMSRMGNRNVFNGNKNVQHLEEGEI